MFELPVRWMIRVLYLTILLLSQPLAAEELPEVAAISARMQQSVDAGQCSGIVTLVARHGEVVHHSAVGLANIEANREMQPDSIFAIASMTKPITATALMMLRDEGKLSVDDPVARYIPEFKAVMLDSGPTARDITIRDVLTHTSGLGGSQECQGSLRETAVELAARKLSFQPGTQWQYSPGLNVAGRVIEVVAEVPFEQFLQERLFAPLGMTDTTFHPSPAQQTRLAQLYQPGEDKKSLAPAQHWLTDLSPDRVPNPSGGLFSTAADMQRFYQMVLNGGEFGGRRYLSAEAVREMTTIQTGDLVTGFTPGNGWGLGWCVVREPQGVTATVGPGTYGHGGAFGTQGWVDPQSQTIFVLMIQRTNFGNSDASDIRQALHELAAAGSRN